MCGIIGFTGRLDAKNVLLEGLEALEYRGYDSAGIAFFDKDKIRTIKTVGKVSALKEKVENGQISDTTCGIGHTRWATHGGVSNTNSHPHTCGRVTLIHNGIIENYREIQEELEKKEMFPQSQTDTEIVAMLLESLYDGNPVKAITQTVKVLEGAYAFCILFSDKPGMIYCLRSGSPLVASYCKEGAVIASDMVALVKYSKEYFILPELHIAELTKDGIKVLALLDKEVLPESYLNKIPLDKISLDKTSLGKKTLGKESSDKYYDSLYQEIKPEIKTVNWDITAAKKGGYPHFMIKEIHEQPEVLRNTITPRIKNKEFCDLSIDNIPNTLYHNINRIIITACGTAMHAGLIGRVVLEKLLRIPVTVEIASEFRYQNPILDSKTLVITISQSGETADTLAALRLANSLGAPTLSIVNVKGSSIARESNYVMYTHGGPEISVASTKAYTCQLACLYLFAVGFASATNKITGEEEKGYVKELFQGVKAVEDTLALENQIKEISKSLAGSKDLFFIGRGMDYALSCEGSIKLKEITYIHSEAYAAGELKHGTLSLVTEGIPVIALATQHSTYGKMVSNIKEVIARGASVILITNGGKEADTSLYKHHISLPEVKDIFTPFTTAICLQMLAYHTCVHLGFDVDQPRNLAKSVTVE